MMKELEKHKKNTSIEGHTSIKKMLVIVMLGFLSMFFIVNVSAAEWDNVKSYDKENEKITIYNWNIIGRIFDLKLAEYTLTDNTD